jgi:hypothetical protein
MVILSGSILMGCSGEKKKIEDPSSVPPTPGAGKSKTPVAPKVEK